LCAVCCRHELCCFAAPLASRPTEPVRTHHEDKRTAPQTSPVGEGPAERNSMPPPAERNRLRSGRRWECPRERPQRPSMPPQPPTSTSYKLACGAAACRRCLAVVAWPIVTFVHIRATHAGLCKQDMQQEPCVATGCRSNAHIFTSFVSDD
jgi:hypothetical protein